jgi:hypothetical protein
MADQKETFQLLYDIQLQGASAAYRNMERLESQIDATGRAMKRATDRKLTNFGSVADQVEELNNVVEDLNTSLNDAAQNELALASQGRRAAKALIQSNEDLRKSSERLNSARMRGDEEAAREEMKNIRQKEGVVRDEIRKTTTLLARQRQLTNDIYETRRGGLGGLAAHANEQDFRGTASNKDILGLVSGGASVARQAGLYAQGKALEMSAAGGNKQMVALLRNLGSSLTKVAALAGGFLIVGKLLFDAYSRGKELNKMFLEGNSLAATMGTELMATPEGLALANVELAKFRSMADDVFTNFKYDLSADNYGAFVAQLGDQGLRVMDSMRGDVNNIQSMLVEAQIMSKNLGVDVGSVMQLQASYMEVLGADMNQLHKAMVLLQDDALNSGMSTKRFYGIIAQATNGMGMYNLRLSETGAVLRQISRAMDSSSAEAFLRKFGQGFQEAGVGDRLKIMGMAGKGNVGKGGAAALESSLKNAIADLSPQQQSALLGALGKVTGKTVGIGGAGKALGQLDAGGIAKLGAELNDPMLMRQIIKISRMAQAAAQNDPQQRALSLGQVAGDIGPMQQVVLQLQALRTAVGKDRVYDAQNAVIRGAGAGFSEQDVRQAQAFEIQAMTDLQRLRDISAAGGDVSGEASKLGYDVTGAGGKLVGKGGSAINNETDLLLSMQEASADKIRKQYEGQKSVAELQIEATRNVADALEKGVQYILTQIYNTISRIYDFLVVNFGDEDARSSARAAAKVREASEGVMNAQQALSKAQTPDEVRAASQSLSAAQGRLRNVQAQADKGRDNRVAAKVDGALGMYSRQELDKLRGEGKVVDTDLNALQKSSAKKISEEEAAAASGVFGAMPRDLIDRLRDGSASEQDLLTVQKKTLEMLGDKGFNIATDSVKKWAAALAEELILNQRANGLSMASGIPLPAAKALLSNPNSNLGSQGLTPDQVSKTKAYYQKANIPLPSGGDAMMLSSGVPALNLKAGDMVIDRSSLASTKYGAPGSLVPDAVRAMTGGAGGGGAGLTVHLHIYGSDRATVEAAVQNVMAKYYRGKRYGAG